MKNKSFHAVADSLLSSKPNSSMLRSTEDYCAALTQWCACRDGILDAAKLQNKRFDSDNWFNYISGNPFSKLY